MASRKKTAKTTKHVPTPEEIANDGSLRYFPYRYAELLEVDGVGQARFDRYTDEGQIALRSVDAIAPLLGTADPLSVRRVQFYGKEEAR